MPIYKKLVQHNLLANNQASCQTPHNQVNKQSINRMPVCKASRSGSQKQAGIIIFFSFLYSLKPPF